MGEKEAAGKLSPTLCVAEVIDSKFVQTEAYIGAQCMGNYQKNKTKSYYRDKMGRNKKLEQKSEASKSR